MLLSSHATIRVSLPTRADRQEIFAKEELKKYLKMIFGTEIYDNVSSPIRKEPSVLISLGSPLRNPDSLALLSPEEWENLSLRQEGYVIRIGKDQILIAGCENADDDHRGLLYGVYDFLEKKLGCCLAAFTKAGVKGGEFIPSLSSVDLGEATLIHKMADNSYRCAIIQYNNWAGNPHHELNDAFIDWLAKNRYNRILTWTSIYDEYKVMGITERLLDRGIRMSVGHHESARTWLPFYGNALFPEHYLETHPEYFRLNADGSRYKPKDASDMEGQWIYCSRNEEAARTVADNLITWIHQNPVVDTIAFWPNDSMSEGCHCEKCAPFTKAENYAYFENEVAKAVSKACPGVRIDMLVYQDLWDFPKNMELSSNLIIDESTWARDGLRSCGNKDGLDLAGTEFERNLLEWHSCGAEAVYYDYFMGNYGNRQRIIPMSSELTPMWRRFKEVGIAGSGTQLECFHLWNHLANLSGFARIGYDTSLTLEDFVDFLCRLFGKGSAPAAQTILLMEETLNGQVRINQGGIYHIKHIDTDKVYALFDEALSLADTPASRNNLRLLRMAFRYSHLEVTDPMSQGKARYSTILPYEDPTGEIRFMANHFDSYQVDPSVGHGSGYAINIPAERGETPFTGNIWYDFE